MQLDNNTRHALIGAIKDQSEDWLEHAAQLTSDLNQQKARGTTVPPQLSQLEHQLQIERFQISQGR